MKHQFPIALTIALTLLAVPGLSAAENTEPVGDSTASTDTADSGVDEPAEPPTLGSFTL